MTEFLKEFEFELSEPLEYHGSKEECAVLKCYAPKGIHFDLVSKLKNIYMSVGMEVASMTAQLRKDASNIEENETKDKDEGNDEDSDEDGAKAVISIIYTCKDGAKIKNFFNTARALILSNGICQYENKQQVRSGFLEKMPFAELEKLIGEYLYNFLFKGD